MWGSESETQAQGTGKGVILATGAAFGGRGTREGAGHLANNQGSVDTCFNLITNRNKESL